MDWGRGIIRVVSVSPDYTRGNCFSPPEAVQMPKKNDQLKNQDAGRVKEEFENLAELEYEEIRKRLKQMTTEEVYSGLGAITVSIRETNAAARNKLRQIHGTQLDERLELILHIAATCQEEEGYTTKKLVEICRPKLGVSTAWLNQAISDLHRRFLIDRLVDRNNARLTHVKVAELGKKHLRRQREDDASREAIFQKAPKTPEDRITFLLCLMMAFRELKTLVTE
jgi:hypothetical protein